MGPISEEYKGATVVAVDIEDLDIGDFDAVSAFMEQHKPDVVFNCAAMTNVDGCETNQEVAMKANAIGPRNLAVMCKSWMQNWCMYPLTMYLPEMETALMWNGILPIHKAFIVLQNLGEQYVQGVL